MNRLLSISLLFLLLASPFLACLPVRASGHAYEFTALQNVVSYIVGRYNDTMKLCSDSEDTGYYYGTWGQYTKLYFLYSDNLFAYHALLTFSPYWAEKIKAGLDFYNYPRDTCGFGVLFGEDIPDHEHDAVEGFLMNETDGTVLVYRRHAGADITNWAVYADRVIYHALDQYQGGHRDDAFTTFSIAEHMFDGKGLYDQGTVDAGWYANYKLALLLYGAWFMDYNLTCSDAVETALWSCQNNETGGIHTAMNMTTGVAFGTSNIETSSAALLPYTLPTAQSSVYPAASVVWYENPVIVACVAVCVIAFFVIVKRF